MKHGDFVIGQAFSYSNFSLWRCTDIGTRTIVAIQLDRAVVVWVTVRKGETNSEERHSAIDLRRDPGWLKGPPYAVAEHVFDEYDLPALHPVAEQDVANWAPTPA